MRRYHFKWCTFVPYLPLNGAHQCLKSTYQYQNDTYQYLLKGFGPSDHICTFFLRVYCASTKQRLVLQKTGKGRESQCMFLALTFEVSACCHKGILCLNSFFKNTECQRGCLPHCCLFSLLCLTPTSGVLTQHWQNHPRQRSLFFKSGYFMENELIVQQQIFFKKYLVVLMQLLNVKM